MRHGKKYRKLGRTSDHRAAMLRNLATALLREGKVRTTVPKAKSLRRVAERLITLGKKQSLSARRGAARVLYEGPVTQKLFGGLATRFAERPGGYTRIVREGTRPGDGAEMCQLQLVDYWEHEGKVASERRQAHVAKKAAAAEEAAKQQHPPHP